MKLIAQLKDANIVFLMIVIISLASCDPENCRDCETFNFDITNWSIMDDTIANELKFIDEQLNEYYFELVDSEITEPYTECQLAGSEESVPCRLKKKIRYSSSNFEFDLIKTYDQIEVPGGNPAVNNCFYLIELRNETDHILTPVLDLFRGIDTINRLVPMDQYFLANQLYTKVVSLKIDSMIVYDTYGTSNVEYVDAELLEVVFQIPNGIVGLTLKNGSKLILVKE